MADETDAEKVARLEQECEELTEQLHFAQAAMKRAASELDRIIKAMTRA